MKLSRAADHLSKALVTTAVSFAAKFVVDAIVDRYKEHKKTKYWSIQVSEGYSGMFFLHMMSWIELTLSSNDDVRHIALESHYARKHNDQKDIVSFPCGTYSTVFKGSKTEIEIQQSDESSSSRCKVVTVSFYGKNAKEAYYSLKHTLSSDSKLNNTAIIRVEGYSPAVTLRPRRKIDSIVLNEDTKQTLFTEVDAWASHREAYIEKGICHKLGILLEGPPGTGKSSLTLALADYMNYDIVYITPKSLENPNLIMDNVKPKSIIVFEDFDKFFPKVVKATSKEVQVADDVSLCSSTDTDYDNKMEHAQQFLLSFLDGLTSPDEVIIIASTNFPENINPQLLRDGRFDLKLHMPLFTKIEAVKMTTNFGMSPSIIDAFPESVWSNPPALQRHLLCNLKNSKSKHRKAK
jgi:hypothetical protein